MAARIGAGYLVGESLSVSSVGAAVAKVTVAVPGGRRVVYCRTWKAVERAKQQPDVRRVISVEDLRE